jgi:sugar phosphate isomerase/epimerase
MMQGRLVPSYDGRIQCFPKANWDEDFRRVAQAGFQTLEWLYDYHDAPANPLNNDLGLRAIQKISRETGVEVASLCAHCFVEQPLVNDHSSQLQVSVNLFSLIAARAAQVGVQRIVLPIEDPHHHLDSDSTVWHRVIDALLHMGTIAARHEQLIAVESTLKPAVFAQLLDPLSRDHFGVNYDTGNSAGFAYDPEEEFTYYGDRIISVHLKDKKCNGESVPLGCGDVTFQPIAELLKKKCFQGDFVLEVVRSVAGDELEYAQRNLTFARTYFGNAA